MDDHRRTALLQEYGEVRSDFRSLTGIRFQLLAFLPIAAGTVAALRKDFEGVAEFGLSLFGLIVTVALLTYNERNNQLYNDLVGRAAAIERSLSLPDGAFANRPGPWLAFQVGNLEWKVDHGSAISLIYLSSVALWLFGVLSPLLHWANAMWLFLGRPIFVFSNTEALIRGTALIAAIGLVALARSYISRQKKGREEEMRALARKLAATAAVTNLDKLALDREFVADCARLSGRKPNRILRKLDYYSKTLDGSSLGYYIQLSPQKVKAAHIVGLIADLPPQWIFDCLTNRQGLLMCLAIVTKGDLSESQLRHLDERLNAPEHRNDNGPGRVWHTYQSGLYAFVEHVSGLPVAIAEASGHPTVVPSWWVDSVCRGKGYGNELVDLLASYVKGTGVKSVGRIPIDTYLGDYDQSSIALAKRFKAHFGQE